MDKFTGVKVFSSTKAREREEMGDRVTAWLKQTKAQIVHTEIRQSSDQEFHCLSIVVFYVDAST